MRDQTKLHPKLQKKIKQLLSKCEKAGLQIKITECLRTKEEQDALYAQGRSKPGAIVTNAKGSSYQSMHQWGVAFDYCRNDGKGAYYDDGFFDKVGAIGQSIGLEWGGAWKSIKDKPHFQLPDWGSGTLMLRLRYGTPEKFFATWGKTSGEDYDMKTIKKGSKGKSVKVWQIIVGVSPDGEFGDKTDKATKTFQKAQGLTADGIVGNKTWNAGLKSI